MWQKWNNPFTHVSFNFQTWNNRKLRLFPRYEDYDTNRPTGGRMDSGHTLGRIFEWIRSLFFHLLALRPSILRAPTLFLRKSSLAFCLNSSSRLRSSWARFKIKTCRGRSKSPKREQNEQRSQRKKFFFFSTISGRRKTRSIRYKEFKIKFQSQNTTDQSQTVEVAGLQAFGPVKWELSCRWCWILWGFPPRQLQCRVIEKEIKNATTMQESAKQV